MESTHSLLPNTSAIKSLPRGIRGVRSERLMKTIQQLDTFPKTTQFVPAFKKEDIDMLNIKILQGRGWGLGKSAATNPHPLTSVGKPTVKDLQRSLGINVMKKMPRERNLGEKKIVKNRLPPPLIGRSLGHGIIQRQVFRYPNLLF